MPQTWSAKQDLDLVLAMLDVVGFKTCDFGKVADTLKALGHETTKEGARYVVLTFFIRTQMTIAKRLIQPAFSETEKGFRGSEGYRWFRRK